MRRNILIKFIDDQDHRGQMEMAKILYQQGYVVCRDEDNVLKIINPPDEDIQIEEIVK